jgi:hypothetical protein
MIVTHKIANTEYYIDENIINTIRHLKDFLLTLIPDIRHDNIKIIKDGIELKNDCLIKGIYAVDMVIVPITCTQHIL